MACDGSFVSIGGFDRHKQRFDTCRHKQPTCAGCVALPILLFLGDMASNSRSSSDSGLVRPAIVYLTQAKHSSYAGRDSLGLLKQSVRLLFENYNSAYRHDLLFFHTGDVSLTVQQEVLSLCMGSYARFHELASHHFSIPPGTPAQKTWRYNKKFSAGYRHMIRFFTSGLWDVLADLGYNYVMRMDEDSFLWSPIRYNIFAFMAQNGYEYGYRLASLERDGQAERFHTFIREYALRRSIQPTWLLNSCRSSKLNNFTLKDCGDTYNIYNNWFVAQVGFWRHPRVQDFLSHINRSHVIYSERWGDLLWQSAALQLFMDLTKVWMFTDFSYEHATFSPTPFPAFPTWKLSRLYGLNRTCLSYGGIVLGDGPAQEAAQERLRILARTPLCRHYRDGRYVMRPCVVHDPEKRAVTSYLLGSVSTVQAGCGRMPAPLYCNSTAGQELLMARTKGGRGHQDSGYRRVQAALGGLCCCHHDRTSKFVQAISGVLGVKVTGVSLTTLKKAPPNRELERRVLRSPGFS